MGLVPRAFHGADKGIGIDAAADAVLLVDDDERSAVRAHALGAQLLLLDLALCTGAR